MTKRTLRGTLRPLAVAAALAAGACGDIAVPDYNNPPVDEFVNNPTPGAVRAAATGLLIGARAGLTDRTGYVAMTGVVGREAYIIDSSDPRYVSELLAGPLTNSGAFGAGMWTERYANIRGANLLLAALETVPGFTDAEKEAIRGWAKTFQALDFLLVINTRDTHGAPIDVAGDIQAPAPFVGKAQVMQRVVQLLDEGRGHLAAAGSIDFPFSIGRGFAEFDSPATFLRFNRALRARVAVYQGDYAGAVTLLPQTFLDTSESLDLGAYHTYASSEGTVNGLANEFIYVHPAVVTEAETQQGSAALDRRVLEKVGQHPDPGSQQGVSSDKQFLLYPTGATDLPVIRNEELILLRAEARWFTGDKPGAMADLNFIRTTSGGLAPIAQPGTDAAFVTELLRQRRYSLLFEGHRWIDVRRFGRLDTLPRDVATHVIVPRWSIPESECLARALPSPCNL